ncbi:MAG: hypothetical protein GY839_04650 [candidate division Zixibacteria bacterium]|nr:hypothetical protein [candidate division Zixibacteria bacterium]
MKKLTIDIKDGYAALATGEDFIKVDFDESDFGETEGISSTSTGLIDFGGQEVIDLYNKADQIALTIPMRFSLIRPVSVDMAAIERYGDEYLQWESRQQLPHELGEFITGFYRLRESFDQKSLQYLFYASSKDFVDVLSNFVSPGDRSDPIIESEAFGLLRVLNLASDNRGFGAIVSLEQGGASVVVAHDGDFRAGRFIAGDSPSLGEEIMYYIIAHGTENDRPRLLVCGDLGFMDHLGTTEWAEKLDLPDTIGLTTRQGVSDPSKFVTIAGLTLKSEKQP